MRISQLGGGQLEWAKYGGAEHLLKVVVRDECRFSHV